jgi:hypothetical protein
MGPPRILADGRAGRHWAENDGHDARSVSDFAPIGTMRKLAAFTNISLDGCFSTQDGGLDERRLRRR